MAEGTIKGVIWYFIVPVVLMVGIGFWAGRLSVSCPICEIEECQEQPTKFVEYKREIINATCPVCEEINCVQEVLESKRFVEDMEKVLKDD